MSSVAYAVRSPMTVIVRNKTGYQLREIPAGAVFFATGSQPDANGMIDGTWQGASVLAFSRDLAERTERFQINARPMKT